MAGLIPAGREPLDAEGLDQAVEVELDDIRIRVLRPEHLIANALKAGRDKDRLRIAMFLQEQKVDRHALASVLDRHQLWATWSEFCRHTCIADPAVIRLRP